MFECGNPLFQKKMDRANFRKESGNQLQTPSGHLFYTGGLARYSELCDNKAAEVRNLFASIDGLREGSVADRVDAGDDDEDDGDEAQESDEDDQENEEDDEEEDVESTDKEALQAETRPHGLGPFDSDGDTPPAPV